MLTHSVLTDRDNISIMADNWGCSTLFWVLDVGLCLSIPSKSDDGGFRKKFEKN